MRAIEFVRVDRQMVFCDESATGLVPALIIRLIGGRRGLGVGSPQNTGFVLETHADLIACTRGMQVFYIETFRIASS